jgi:hypothetical protein
VDPRRVDRPHMPGYGVAGADAGAGLLPWSWAVGRLTASPQYWVAAVDGAGRPHVMPVWGVWWDGAVWFSSSPGSRRARSLAVRPACTVATADPHQPVAVEGDARRIADDDAVAAFAARSNAKYEVAYSVDFYRENATFRVAPRRVIGLDDADFTGTPTRWTF